MAYTTKSSFVSFALILVILGTSSLGANALSISGIPVSALGIVGIAHCSPTVTGACTTCQPLANIRVRVRLNGNIIASGNTGNDGSFRIVINVGNIITSLNDISNIRVLIDLPIVGCPVWASVSTGHLEGSIVPQTGGILNGVLNCLVPSCGLVY